MHSCALGPLFVLLLVTPSSSISSSEACTVVTLGTPGSALLQSKSNTTQVGYVQAAVPGLTTTLAHLGHKNVQLLQEMLGQPSEMSEVRSELVALLLEAEFLSLTNIALFYAIGTMIAAIYYRETFKWPDASQSDSSRDMDTWQDEARDYANNMELCCWSMCCCPVRYADNMSHVGISDFWSIVAVIVTLNCLSLFVPSWIASLCLCTYGRQLFRQKFDMPNCTQQTILGDCLLYFCCPSLAVAQEARHLHAAALVGHPAIVHVRLSKS
mmetsp:Transcript_19460/g.45247  ORF Transcript_19460/g.45247 Transcript_19460/m.45247 type:complete len:269 (-) Transcript_19460:33-839(-)